MLKWSARLLVVGWLAASIGCGGGEALVDDGEIDDVEANGRQDGVGVPIGAYVESVPQVTHIIQLDLGADRRFTSRTMVACMAATCQPLHDGGSYRLTRSGDLRYLRLARQSSRTVDRFEYRLVRQSGGRSILSLRKVDDAGWYDLRPSDGAALCGGIANLTCAPGQECQLDGASPDAGGHCVPGASGPAART